MDDVEHLKDQARFVWSQGDYPEIAKMILPAAEELVEAASIGPDSEVLDVGAGNGNVAVTAAAKGARVVAVDLTPALVSKGRQRTLEAGLEIEWQEADAEDLPFEDGRFDVATSSFAAIFAPRAHVAAAEMMRVVRPGGLVAMTTWSQSGFVGDSMLEGDKFRPPIEPGVDSPASWGDPDVVRARFAPHSDDIEITTREIRWRFDSIEAWSRWSETNAPPMIVAKMKMPPDTYAQMRQAFEQLAERYNTATDGTMDVPAEYLIVVARKRPQ